MKKEFYNTLGFNQQAEVDEAYVLWQEEYPGLTVTEFCRDIVMMPEDSVFHNIDDLTEGIYSKARLNMPTEEEENGEEEALQAIHLTLKKEDFSEELNQTIFSLDITKNILNWPEEPSNTITFVAPEAELQSFLNKIKGMGEIELEDLQYGQYWDGDKIIMVENGNILY